jgi:hypothetical protein
MELIKRVFEGMEESYNDSEYASGRIFRKLDIFI